MRPPSESAIEPGDSVLRSRLVLVCGGFLCAFSLLSWRLIHLQVVCHKDLAARAEKHRMEKQKIVAPRGRIFDSRGSLLARDEPVQRVIFDLSMIRDPQAVLRLLLTSEKKRDTAFQRSDDIRSSLSHRERQNLYIARVTEVIAPWLAAEGEPFPDARVLADKIMARRGERETASVILEKGVSVEKGARLREALEKAGLGEWMQTAGCIGAVRLEDTFVRRTRGGVPLDHIVGRYGGLEVNGTTVQTGVSGVERSCDALLLPQDGEREFEVDGAGAEMPGYRSVTKPPKPGRHLRLAVDSGLQQVVTDELLKDGPSPETSLSALQPERAIVVLFEPKTMCIRAVVAVDRTLPEGEPMMMNHAVQYLYEPGSTIKIATLAAAIDTGAVGLKTEFNLYNGRYEAPGVKAIIDHKGMETGTTRDIFLESSNIGSYLVAQRGGARNFERYLKAFGFAAPTGTQLPAEAGGWLPKGWQGDYFARSAFGYGLAVTPLQMCAMLGCVLNDGEWRTPRMVEGFADERGRLVEPWPEGTTRRVISPATAKIMRDLLRDVVEDGTGEPAKSRYYSVAGKTGSAKVSKKGGYDRDPDYVLSFLGCMPAENPRLAGILIIDKPALGKHEAWGGKVAGPMFTRIMERAMSWLQVAPEFADDSTSLAESRPQ